MLAKPLYTSHKGFACNPCGNCLFNAYNLPTNIYSGVRNIVLHDEIAMDACRKNPIISGWGQITYCPFIHQHTVKNRDRLTEKTQQNSLDSLGIILITFYL